MSSLPSFPARLPAKRKKPILRHGTGEGRLLSRQWGQLDLDDSFACPSFTLDAIGVGRGEGAEPKAKVLDGMRSIVRSAAKKVVLRRLEHDIFKVPPESSPALVRAGPQAH